MLAAASALSAASHLAIHFKAHEYDFRADLAAILPTGTSAATTEAVTEALLTVFRQHEVAINAHYCKQVIASIAARQAHAAKVTPWLRDTLSLVGTYRKMDGSGPCQTLYKAAEAGIDATAVKQKANKPTANYHTEFHTREMVHDVKARVLARASRGSHTATDFDHLLSDILAFFASYHDWEQSAKGAGTAPFINEAKSAQQAVTAFTTDVISVWADTIERKHGTKEATRWQAQAAEIITFWAEQVIVNATHPVFSFPDGVMQIDILEMIVADAELALASKLPAATAYLGDWRIHEVGLCDTAMSDIHRATMPWVCKGTPTAGALRLAMTGSRSRPLPADNKACVLMCPDDCTATALLTGQSIRMGTEMGLSTAERRVVARLLDAARRAPDMVRFGATAAPILKAADVTALFAALRTHLGKEGGFIHAVKGHPKSYFNLLAARGFVDPLLGSEGSGGKPKFGSMYCVDAWDRQAHHLLAEGSGLVTRLGNAKSAKQQQAMLLQLMYVAGQQDGVRLAKMAAPRRPAPLAAETAGSPAEAADSGGASALSLARARRSALVLGCAVEAKAANKLAALHIDGESISAAVAVKA